MQATLIGGIAYQDKVLATLTVLEGPKGLVGKAIRVIKPTSIIGRNPTRCDITFYAEEEPRSAGPTPPCRRTATRSS